MPELFMWLLVGTLGFAGDVSHALYQVTLFDTYLRPSAARGPYADDVVPPLSKEGFFVLIISPVERETSTTVGAYAETIVLDGGVRKDLGQLLHEQAVKVSSRSRACGAGTPRWKGPPAFETFPRASS